MTNASSLILDKVTNESSDDTAIYAPSFHENAMRIASTSNSAKSKHVTLQLSEKASILDLLSLSSEEIKNKCCIDWCGTLS